MAIYLERQPQHFVTERSPSCSLSLEHMTSNSQYITDCRYNGHSKQTRFGGNRHYRQSCRDSLPKKCFVCHKGDCWSICHTKEERAKVYDRFKTSQYIQDFSLAAFQQFLAGFEGSEP
jgi:hypothetical protein